MHSFTSLSPNPQQVVLNIFRRQVLAFCVAATGVVVSCSSVWAQSGTTGSSTSGSRTVGSSTAGSSTGSAARPMGSGSGTTRYEIAMNGFCPVCILEMKKWVRGNQKFSVLLDGKLYLFPEEKQKQMFLKNVTKYTPVLSGDCVVCFVDGNTRAPGSVYYSAIHNSRLYLFPSQGEKDTFMSNPKKYENADLALGGMCSVCRVEMQQNVPGKPEFGHIHKGKRYYFPSMDQKKMFLANPTKYEEK